MKTNIDLTQNRIFSRNTFNTLTSLLITQFNNKSKYPWNIYAIEEINTEDDLSHQKQSIIALGNKIKRAEIKMYREMDSTDYCDCCGSRMNIIPWDIEVGVCHKCNSYMEKENDKCLWRYKDPIRNAVIRTV